MSMELKVVVYRINRTVRTFVFFATPFLVVQWTVHDTSELAQDWNRKWNSVLTWLQCISMSRIFRGLHTKRNWQFLQDDAISSPHNHSADFFVAKGKRNAHRRVRSNSLSDRFSTHLLDFSAATWFPTLIVLLFFQSASRQRHVKRNSPHVHRIIRADALLYMYKRDALTKRLPWCKCGLGLFEFEHELKSNFGIKERWFPATFRWFSWTIVCRGVEPRLWE